jgi:hypothetical protein
MLRFCLLISRALTFLTSSVNAGVFAEAAVRTAT